MAHGGSEQKDQSITPRWLKGKTQLCNEKDQAVIHCMIALINLGLSIGGATRYCVDLT